MDTRIFKATAITALIGLALLSGCSARDRAGGQAAQSVTTLSFAQGNDGVPGQLVAFAQEVKRASGGTVSIDFKNSWRMGESDSEAATISDVKAGKVNLAWVGARAFDQVGDTSFQALLAPLLVDSQDLQQKVFEAGVPGEMLDGADKVGVVGVGVLPGPMRKLLSTGAPLTSPGALSGKKIGIAASKVAEQTFALLGATTSDLPSSAALKPLDGMEQQMASIWGNHYETKGATSVVANLNLWPRPLVIVMSKATNDRLDATQRGYLRKAAAAAAAAAEQSSREEDDSGTANLCQAGLAMPRASEAQLAAFRKALEPVYDAIAKDPKSAAWLGRIRDLKGKLGAAPDLAACSAVAAKSRPTATSGIPEGTYQSTITAADWAKKGLTPDPGFTSGVFTMTFEQGVVTGHEPSSEVGFRATYTTFRDRLETQGGADPLSATFVVKGDTVTFTHVDNGACSCEPYKVVWESHPWTRVSP